MSTIANLADTAIRTLQSKIFLDHYAEVKRDRYENQFRIARMKDAEKDIAKIQFQLQHKLIEKKKLQEQLIKASYSKQYEASIAQKERSHFLAKQKQTKEEQRLLQMHSWIKDQTQQRQEEMRKRIVYGRELQKHIQMQEQNKIVEKQMQKSMRAKIEKQIQEKQIHTKKQIQNRYLRKIHFQQQQNQRLGLREYPLSMSEIEMHDSYPPQSLRSKYQRGLSVQLESSKTENKLKESSIEKTPKKVIQTYNTITNPIPYKYKNPNVLRMLELYK